MGLVMKAMKKEWWYDIFDVERSQFDVGLIIKKNLKEFAFAFFFYSD